jgi:RNA polymerase sigma factor (sigma-70 family)
MAYDEGNQDLALEGVKKLAEMRVRSLTVGFQKDRQREIIQSCVVAAWEGRFEARSRFSTWVMSIIKHQIHSAFRHVKQERESKLLYLSDAVGRDEDDNELTLEDVIGSESPKYRRVESKPFPSEQAFHVFDLQERGLSLKEIAQRQGISYDAIRQRVSRWTREMVPFAE